MAAFGSGSRCHIDTCFWYPNKKDSFGIPKASHFPIRFFLIKGFTATLIFPFFFPSFQMRYDFEMADAESLVAAIQDQVRLCTNGSRGFDSIAFACHGPPDQKERAAQAAVENMFHWEISRNIHISDPSEFDDRNNPVRRVMFALANAVVEGRSRAYPTFQFRPHPTFLFSKI